MWLLSTWMPRSLQLGKCFDIASPRILACRFVLCYGLLVRASRFHKHSALSLLHTGRVSSLSSYPEEDIHAELVFLHAAQGDEMCKHLIDEVCVHVLSKQDFWANRCLMWSESGCRLFGFCLRYILPNAGSGGNVHCRGLNADFVWCTD